MGIAKSIHEIQGEFRSFLACSKYSIDCSYYDGMIVFLQKSEQTLDKIKVFLGDSVSGEDEAKAIEAFSTITDLLTHSTLITSGFRKTIA